MGTRLVKYEFSPKENEQIEAVIKVPEETRSVIHGVVIDCRNKPIKNAVVKLLEVLPGNPSRLKPLTHTFTDEYGQFLFGPLYCDKKYAIKIWYSDVKIRELIITPDCDGRCDDEIDDDQSDDHYDERHSDEYRDGYYDGHCDINIDDYFGGQSDDRCDEQNDEGHSDVYDYHVNIKDDNRQERHSDDNKRNKRNLEKRRDRHSDDDNHIHYKEPKVYGQKCAKCEITKTKINNFEDIEK